MKIINVSIYLDVPNEVKDEVNLTQSLSRNFQLKVSNKWSLDDLTRLVVMTEEFIQKRSRNVMK